jgi:biopolymer transport protein TolR
MATETGQEAGLSPAQRSKIRRLSQPAEPAPGDEAGELNVVPYLDIITNILVFVLATIAVVYMTNVDVSAGGDSGKTRSPTQNKAMNLTLIIANDGIGVKTARGGIAPGCESGSAQYGEGSAVRAISAGQEYDYEALQKCVSAAKKLDDNWSEEHNVTITANGGVEFHTIIAVADAIRFEPPRGCNSNADCGDGGACSESTHQCNTPLFPDVHFGALR